MWSHLRIDDATLEVVTGPFPYRRMPYAQATACSLTYDTRIPPFMCRGVTALHTADRYSHPTLPLNADGTEQYHEPSARTHLLDAALPIGERATTVSEKKHPTCALGISREHRAVLHHMATSNQRDFFKRGPPRLWPQVPPLKMFRPARCKIFGRRYSPVRFRRRCQSFQQA